ncbi:hypothetical protein TWF481_002444 [Arthrobotrys musiformis]|uniref:Integral membrane protein n=1 Tax=Arthrobotrys musiformis TaxID=47236 RepID=A0AAV9VTC7_9PEZI
MQVVSYFARHEPHSPLHVAILSFHGVWALICWAAFVLQWLLPKGTYNHKTMGLFIFWGFLFPLEVTGVMLVPYLFWNSPRTNILLTSGYLAVPSMGFHFMITTLQAFPFIRKWTSASFIKWLSIVGFIMQVGGVGGIGYKIVTHMEEGIHHENNIELFLLNTPFTIMQGILLARPHLRSLGHGFYIKYLTLQMFPGTMIVFARDKYWLWGADGVSSLYVRILIEYIPMIPFFMMVCPVLLAPRKAKETRPLPQKINGAAVKSTATTARRGSLSAQDAISSRLSSGLVSRHHKGGNFHSIQSDF